MLERCKDRLRREKCHSPVEHLLHRIVPGRRDCTSRHPQTFVGAGHSLDSDLAGRRRQGVQGTFEVFHIDSLVDPWRRVAWHILEEASVAEVVVAGLVPQ